MKRFILLLTMALAGVAIPHAQLTLEYCIAKADENYPLIKKYRLVEQTHDIALSDINKGWLPRAGIYGQATAQNIVPGFPETLKGMLNQLGQEMRGLGKVQYKIGIDISQTIWDGGASKAKRDIERAEAAENEASLEVGMYAMHERVMNLFFSILLINEQISLTTNTLELLKANDSRMRALLANGVAMQSDVDMVEAQLLTVGQQLSIAENALKGYREVLGLFIGENLSGRTLEKPAADYPTSLASARPELSMYSARLSLNKARLKTIDASVMPRAAFFAQAYYGYPGFNYFESMMNRDLSFNVLAGIKLSWNIEGLYTRKNSRSRLAAASAGIEADRDVFMFNSNQSSKLQQTNIEGLRDAMKDDDRIVELRANVRRAAESQLENGIIDATALLTKITDENQARLTASLHCIELLNDIYKLKYLLNQ